jgi:DNA-binding MarR family transcriptional regulator
MFDQRDTLGHATARIARMLAGELREALTPLGLLPAQFAALAEIAQSEGMSQKELVVRLEVEQPGVARTLNGLEAMGWIARRSRGGRTRGLYLTDRARSVLPRAIALAAAIECRATSSLSRTERAQLLDRLEELAEEIGGA